MRVSSAFCAVADARSGGACELERLARTLGPTPSVEAVEELWRVLDLTRTQLQARGVLPLRSDSLDDALGKFGGGVHPKLS